jgi:hypothetical protein
VDRRKCQYLTPKEQSYGGITIIQILYHKRPAPVLSLQLPPITKNNVADAWRSNNMATNETMQPAATTMVIRNIKRVVVHMVSIVMTETKVITVLRLRALQNVHKLKS